MAIPLNDSYTASVGTTIYGGTTAPAPAPTASLTLTAPSPASGTVGVASGNFTVQLVSGTGSVTITPASTPGSTLTPSSFTVSPGSPTNYFTLNALTAAVHTVSISNNTGLTNPSSVIYTSSPAPAPAPSPSSNLSSSSGAASFSLTSASGVTNAPFTVGMGFIEGQFPASSGLAVTGLGTNYQTSIKNQWPDGSIKFAVVSGRATIGAGKSIVSSAVRGTPPVGTALTEADLTATGITASIQFGTDPAVQLGSLIGVAATGASNGAITGGRVRQLISGPQMSSWLYCARTNPTNVHVVAWFEVRLYAGGHVHVLPWIENGWTRVSGCAGQAGDLVFTLAGTTRFTQTAVHLAGHCRVVAQDVEGCGYWPGVAPDIYAVLDPNYLQSTGLVPPYWANTTASSTRLTALTQIYSPTNYGQLVSSPRNVLGNGTMNGNFDTGMGDAGYHAGIGPIPEWEAYFLTSNADYRAWKSVIANAMGYGRYGVHWRDELTLRPVNPADVINKTLPQTGLHNIASPGANQFGGSETLPDVTLYDPGSGGIRGEYWTSTHHPSAGYVAYLLTGHEFFLELCQFNAGICFLRQNNVQRNYAQGLQLTHMETTRGAAWSLRSIFQAAAISEDGTSLKTGFAGLATSNIAYYLANYITSPCGSFGAPRPYSNFQPSAVPPRYNVNAWEIDFSICAWGFGLSMKPVSGTTLTNMASFFQWHAQFVVGRLGPLGDATAYGFNAAGRQNSVTIANSNTDAPWVNNSGPWLSNWGEAFELTIGVNNSTNTTNTIGAIDSNNGFFPDATSYWANLQTALAYAVKFNVPGAREGYLRMINASNWSSFETAVNTAPVGALRALNSPPKWGSQLVANTFVDLASTSFEPWMTANLPPGAYRGSGPVSSPIDAFCDPATDPVRGHQYIYGGGHGDGTNNGVYKFDVDTLSYSISCVPTPPSVYLPSYNRDIIHPDWADPVAYPSGALFAGAVGGVTVFDNNKNIYAWFRTLEEGLNPVSDAAYVAPFLARASSHMYGAACMRGDEIHYFYLTYGVFNTRTGKWSGFDETTSIGKQLVDIQPNLLNTPLQQGTFAVYDDVTDKFIVTLQPGDAGSGNRCGLFIFNAATRRVENVYTYGVNFVAPSSPIVKAGRKVWLFRKLQLTSYNQPHSFNRGIIFDIDTRTTVHFSIQGNPSGTGLVAMTSNQETCPTVFDGSRIVRWNYDSTNRNNVHFIDVNQTPVSGSGTQGDPYIYVQTSRAISNPPTNVTFAYTRWAYVAKANAIIFIPRANSNYKALYLP